MTVGRLVVLQGKQRLNVVVETSAVNTTLESVPSKHARAGPARIHAGKTG